MGFFQIFTNYLNSVVGRNQEFEELIAAKDISRVKSLFSTREMMAMEAIKEYNTSTHEIMKRPDKILLNQKGERKGKVKRWKLPIGYPQYINEISLVFIYGRPVKWQNLSEGTDNAFKAYLDLIKSTHFNSKIRQCKRYAGAETESALLFRVFRNKENKPDCQLRVLARSKGDEMYSMWDLYENLVAFAWGYYTKENSTHSSYHFDIFTPKKIYRCTRKFTGWDVIEEENIIGKIPVILFRQEKEWNGVEPLIEREEYIGSRTADANDYFSDPMFLLNSDIIKNMPEKGDANKTLVVKGLDDVSKAARFLTWDNAPESKQKEIEWLQKHILTKTFTPEIDFDNMKGLSNVSGKALKQMMILADIKAQKHKDSHDELLDRTASLFTSIIGNVLNIALKSECDKLVVAHEYQEPFGEDIAESLQNIVEASDGGIMSTETAVELNPLVKDHTLELKRLKQEKEERQAQQNSIFNDNEGAGAQSFNE